MKTSADWLREVMRRHDLPSHYAAAKLIGIHASTAYQYRDGARAFDNFTAARVAELLGIDPVIVIASAEAERGKNGKHRAYWEKLATAALVALGIGLGGASSPAPAAPNNAGLCIMLNNS